MQVHALVVDVYEPSTRFRYPVIRHVFYGASREEAEGYYRAHLRNDNFLRSCAESKAFEGRLCEVDVRWESQRT